MKNIFTTGKRVKLYQRDYTGGKYTYETLFVIEEMKIKTSVWYRITHPLEWLKLKCWKYQMLLRVQSRENSPMWPVGMKKDQPLWKTAWEFPYDPSVPLLSIYSREVKTYIHTKTCPWMFMAAFFIITPNCKQSQALQWVNG